MVIQRWQSLLLLVAVILMGILCVSPLATMPATTAGEEVKIYLTDYKVLMVVDILIGVLLFICIFMFKNLKMQMKATLLSLLLMCVLAVGAGFTLWVNAPQATLLTLGAVLILFLAAVFTICAYRFMRRDYRLLRSASRLR